ncbi:hypothetical protein Taro_011167 [Colocasia esculenta]|uniref:Uncharacterized protein n=1 Tax=Colocasia esculenta TaxID=4460 RepID=A0A843U9V1_COLES|nr:hypothetical protein [Colocasia esculenta]
MRIFVRPVIETAQEAPIQNWHFYPVGTKLYSEISGPAPKFLSGSVAIRRRFGVGKPSFRTPKLCFQPMVSPFPRFSGSNVTLDYANH